MTKNGRLLAARKKIVNYKQSRFVRFAHSGHKNVISKARGQERDKRVMLAVAKNGEMGASNGSVKMTAL